MDCARSSQERTLVVSSSKKPWTSSTRRCQSDDSVSPDDTPQPVMFPCRISGLDVKETHDGCLWPVKQKRTPSRLLRRPLLAVTGQELFLQRSQGMRRGEDCCSFPYHQITKGGSEGEEHLSQQPCRWNPGSLAEARKFSGTKEANLSKMNSSWCKLLFLWCLRFVLIIWIFFNTLFEMFVVDQTEESGVMSF